MLCAHTEQQHGHHTGLAGRDTSARIKRRAGCTRAHTRADPALYFVGQRTHHHYGERKKKGCLGLARLQTLLGWLLRVPPKAAGCANLVATFSGKIALLLLRKLPQDRSKNTFQASLVLKPTRAVPDVRHCSAELHANGGVQMPLKAASRHD